MTYKEQILEALLNKEGAMTQSELAIEVKGDKKYYRHIRGALMELVKAGEVIRTKEKPIIYAIPNGEILEKVISKTTKRSNRYLLPITNEMVENIQIAERYRRENELITNCLKKYPYNTDTNIIAMKIGLIDITNSTNISRYKNIINVVELAEKIKAIPDIDKRIQNGDLNVVKEIAEANGKINLFSFATKYCCYHNYNLYGKDNYSIFDNVLKESLPLYFNEVTKSSLEKMRKEKDYKTYNDLIGELLSKKGITAGRRKFDHFIWYNNR